ncbi:hypothetical protein DICPUDRAFT_152254 [Dictyostelium purpureum]|uniref:Uncharacterized protein n=1 Tax=Dictyostelium purpureum TaxID=5786 RepID=F0ZKV9_DICPU|nr:uncharacterized protein DICPUDRAFT_152254 [Dictyostelium purpureum]EGC35429.1 hypothetical protein DICPUDRAFT_152254 [Dictyostelium purpureum]|eukprot:XP_003288042.1 hypothetical protein DICPUDRAFT_152254 [Dictyostelium purpureum]
MNTLSTPTIRHVSSNKSGSKNSMLYMGPVPAKSTAKPKDPPPPTRRSTYFTA